MPRIGSVIGVIRQHAMKSLSKDQRAKLLDECRNVAKSDGHKGPKAKKMHASMQIANQPPLADNGINVIFEHNFGEIKICRGRFS